MNTNGGALNFDAYIGDTDFNKTIQSMNRKLEGLTKTTQTESKKMESTFSNLGRLAAGGLAAAGLAQLPQQILKVRGEFQQLEISFTTMLRSKAKADKLIGDIATFAGTTPYGLADSAQATKLLLAYGASADTVLETLRKLGDVASGVSQPLGEIAYLYGTTMVQGRLYTQDLNQFLGRGIPLLGELAKILGVADTEVKGLVEAGKVGFPEVQKAFENMTAAGSMFGGLMEAQSKSLVGQQAALGDAVDAVLNKIGKSQEGTLSAIFAGATSVVENYEKIIDVLKVVVATYGAYRAALLITAAVQGQVGLLQTIKMWGDLALSVKSAKDAQILFNLATKANPYVLLATAVTALAAGYLVFGNNTNEATRAQELMAEATKRADDEMAKEISNIEVLKKQLGDETKTREEKKKILDKLIALNPEILKGITLENAATGRATELINEYIRAKKEQIRVSRIQAQIDENLQRSEDIRSGRVDSEFKPGAVATAGLGMAASAAGMSGGYFDQGKAVAKSVADNKKAALDALKDLNNGLLNQIDNGIEQRRKRRKGESTEAKKDIVRDVKFYDDAIKNLEDSQKKTTSKAQYDAIEKQIKSLRNQRDGITGSKEKGAAKKAADDVKEAQIKSFAEELEEKKNLYELYNRWVLNYGQKSADEQFASLREKNKDYLSYVETEIARLEAMRDTEYSGKLSNQDKFDLDTLTGEKNRLLGGKSPTELFTEQLDAARDSAGSLTEELIALQDIQKGLNPDDRSAAGLANRQAVIEREIEVQKARKRLLADFLVDVTASEQQMTAVSKHYSDLRATLDATQADHKAEVYLKALDRINEAEKKEITQIKQKSIEESKAYKELQKIIDLSLKDETAKRLEAEKEKLAMLEAGTDAYIEQLKRVRSAEEEHRQKSIQTWQAIAGAVGDLGSAMEGMGGTISEIGGAISGLAKNASSLSSVLTMKKGDKLSMDQYAAAVQGVIEIVTTLIQAGKRRAEAERQFAAARLGFENDYQLALTNKKGDNYKKNPFYQDYEGQVKAAVDQYGSALDKYEAAIEKLEEGKVKTRQKNVVDGKTVGQLAGAGAATGALVGSVLPGVGTAVGAVVGAAVGAIAGLFAKKKKDVFGSLMEQYPELVTQTAEGWSELNVEMANALITNGQVDDATKVMLENAIALNESLEEAKEKIQATAVELTGMVGDNLKNALVEAFRAGDSAAKALQGTVSDIIADVTSKLLFASLVGPALDQLVKEMTNSLSAGDGTIVDDLVRFNEYGLPEVEKYFQGLEEFDKWAKAQGFDDVFGKNGGTGSTDQAMQGVIKGVSEETVSVLIGQTNAIRIYQAQMAFDTRQSVLYLSTIAQNTAHNKHLVLLFDVVDRLERLNATSIRGFGL